MTMTSNRPYFIRAIYDWIVDNHLTPYLLVNAEFPGIEIPHEHVNDGRIVLNIAPQACRGLHLDNDRIVFTARFSGIATQISLGTEAVLAIYAKENGRGMEFGPEYDGPTPPTPPNTGKGKGDSSSRGKPVLKLVK